MTQAKGWTCKEIAQDTFQSVSKVLWEAHNKISSTDRGENSVVQFYMFNIIMILSGFLGKNKMPTLPQLNENLFPVRYQE